jgi:hypothetical protein
MNSTSSSRIQGNVFTGTTGEATVLLESCSSEQLHSIPFDKNTFHNPEAEFEVKLKDDVRGSYSILDMRNNFWGTTDLEAIQSRIRDSEAFFELCTVDFDPPAEAVPLTTTPTYPDNGNVSGTSAPELGWKVNGWSPTFKVELSRSDTFNDLLFSKEGITERRFSLLQKELKEVFVDGETIWWRVTPESSSGSYLNPSAPSSFKIMLASPVLSSPSNGERLYQGWNPLLEWNPTEHMSSYFVQIDDDEDFSTPVVEGKSLNASYQTPFILPEGVTYHWRVRGLDRNETTGPWSDVWSFRIPLPGLGVEITDILPVKVDLNIQGPDTLYTYQSTGFSILSNVVPTETRWYLNAEDLGTMNTFYWPSKPIGYYTLTAMIQYGGRWYSVSKIVEVKADRGGTL